MLYDNEKRKHKDVTTSKMLDHVGKRYEYEDEKNKELKQEYENELEHREPFDDLKRKIDRQHTEIRELRKVIDQMQNHRHDPLTGNIMVFRKEQEYSRRI